PIAIATRPVRAGATLAGGRDASTRVSAAAHQPAASATPTDGKNRVRSAIITPVAKRTFETRAYVMGTHASARKSAPLRSRSHAHSVAARNASSTTSPTMCPAAGDVSNGVAFG